MLSRRWQSDEDRDKTMNEERNIDTKIFAYLQYVKGKQKWKRAQFRTAMLVPPNSNNTSKQNKIKTQTKQTEHEVRRLLTWPDVRLENRVTNPTQTPSVVSGRWVSTW